MSKSRGIGRGGKRPNVGRPTKDSQERGIVLTISFNRKVLDKVKSTLQADGKQVTDAEVRKWLRDQCRARVAQALKGDN